jgi:hypothetical protein
MKGDGIASNCWRISYSITPSAHPDVPMRVGGVLSNKNTRAGPTNLLYPNLNFRRHQIRRQLSSESSLLCYGKSRITATTYNLFADKSTFEGTEATVQRFIRFKVNGSF